jgi:hypothetical protein
MKDNRHEATDDACIKELTISWEALNIIETHKR